MKFSIIVPVYNVEAYVEEALNSLLAQDYSDYEVIMIDDGSTDRSSEICQDFAKNDCRFKYVRQKNRGQSIARNVGLSMAVGDFIYFFDSDDLLRADSLSSWAGIFRDDSIDAVLFEAETFTSEKNVPFFPDYKRNVVGSKKLRSDEYLVESLKSRCYTPSPCCYVVRREKIGDLLFYPGIIHEDELYYFELFAANSYFILVSDQAYFKRRIRVNSIMTSSTIHKRLTGYETCIRVIIGKYQTSTTIKLEPIVRLYLLYLDVFSRLDFHKRISFNERRNLFMFYLSISRLVPFGVKYLLGSLAPELLILKRYLSH